VIASPMPQAGPPRIVPLPRSHEIRLDNGLRVIASSRSEIAESLHIPLVSALLAIDRNGEADPPKLPGVAAMTSSLMRQGTKSHTALELDLAVDAIGARLERAAGYDSNSAGAGATTAVFPQALELLAETIREPTFLQAEFERVRTRSLSDLRLQYSSPSTLARLVAARLIGGDSPYGLPVAGTPRSLEALTRDDVVAFHRRAYRPERATLLLGGDIKVDEAFELARRAFGDWKPDSHPGSEVAGGTQPPARRRIVAIDKPDAGRTAVIVTRPAPARRSGAYYAGVVSGVLLSGYSGRLNQEVRVKRGLSYGAGASVLARRNAGQFVASTLVDHKRTVETIEVILETLASLATAPPDEGELTRRKTSSLGSWNRAIETNEGLLNALADFALYGIPLDELEHYSERVLAVDGEAIKNYAEAYVIDEPTIVLVGDTRAYAQDLGAFAGDVRIIPVADLDIEGLR
jgi:zinc protease